jgi:glycosyltransferase involved in cell wall biosynthesis
VKILHVETGRHFLGGPQQVIYLIKALQERGHDNVLVCPPGAGIDRVARQTGIRVQNLSCAGDLDLLFAWRLVQFLKQSSPDLLHCHSRRGADFLGGIATRFAALPAVVSRRVDNTEMRFMATMRYRPFQKIVAISEAIAGVLRGQGVDGRRITVIPDAVDATAFSKSPDCARFREEFALHDGIFTVAAAGQLIARKGHRFLLRAIASLRHRYPLRLIIFGEGPLDTALRAEAAELELHDVVQFAGFRDDLDDFIACFDILAHPALAEGMGVITLKAAAAAVPVVGFDAGGLKEAVRHGTTGLLVPVADSASLAAAIATLLDSAALRRKFGEAGRTRMQREFSTDTMATSHIELYESVLSG